MTDKLGDDLRQRDPEERLRAVTKKVACHIFPHPPHSSQRPALSKHHSRQYSQLKGSKGASEQAQTTHESFAINSDISLKLWLTLLVMVVGPRLHEP